MFTLPNILSLIRVPLAFVFLQQNITWRICAIILAMITDGLDGFLARRYKSTSQLGATLDPLMDKFFVFFTLCVLLGENRLTVPEVAAMLCRDFSVIFFGFYLVIKGTWSKYKFRSIWCGKITTALQLFVLIGLTLHIHLPSYLFFSFIALGLMALGELYLSRPKPQPQVNPENLI